MEKAFIQNRTLRTDQLSTLRQVLDGSAKKLVPKNTPRVEEAWEVLKEAYGDLDRVMSFQKKKLLQKGNMPGPNGKGGFKRQAERLHEVELALIHMIELAKKHLELEHKIWNFSMTKAIYQLFPTQIQGKFQKVEGKEKRFRGFMQIIKKLRVEAQHLTKMNEGTEKMELGP